MLRRIFGMFIIIVLAGLTLLADVQLPPHARDLTTAEKAALAAPLGELEGLLGSNDFTLLNSPDQWSSHEFAVYCAGVLSAHNYETALVRTEVDTWVLVAITAGSKLVWVPVLPSLMYGSGTKRGIGRIPWSGPLSFDSKYLNPSELIQQQPNVGPLANIRGCLLYTSPSPRDRS